MEERQGLERLDRKDFRLIAVCAVVAAVSLFIGVRYFFKAFPEAQIEFKTTKKTSLPIAQDFLTKLALPTAGYRHASLFDFDDEAKTFLEREVGAEESGKLLDGPIRLWLWRHRWFRPLQKEELQVDVTTKGEVVGFHHLLKEEDKGADLTAADARAIAETFLTTVMGRKLEDLTFVEGAVLKRPARTDHDFTWKLKGADVHGADYRIKVGVAGDKAASYEETLNLPDAYKESYKRLRSKNQTAGVVDSGLLLLTVIAMMVLLVARIRRGDVKWGPAGVLGAVTFVFGLLSQLNNLPADLYYYDTTKSLPVFLLQALFLAVLQGLSVGAVIFLIAASAEPLYRERFPRMQSLSSLVRFRALRTRETFIALVVGLTLTCFFFAYENVFYLIAIRLGAWAPRDVGYSDLLSTAFPWVYVLFIGWLPAISEEFISRMFSIPFFEKAGGVLRLPTALRMPLALFVAAIIWSFGHAAYPNQPWWIRGLEVGIAGLVFGLVLLRWGIVAVVACHFSVDALYTAFVMIRSGDPYYVATGALCAGVFGLLLIAAFVLYVSRGGFLRSSTNAEEGVAPALPPAPPRAARADASATYRRQPAAMVAIGIAAAIGLGALACVHLDGFGDWADYKITKQRARESAETFLRGHGFDVASYQVAVSTLDRTDPTAASYLRDKGGLEVVKAAYRDLVPTPLWRVRFYIPEKKEEYRVSVDPSTGGVLGFTRTLPDDAPGGSLDKAEALTRAEAFMASMSQDLKRGVLKEQTEKDEKARRDHTLVWEFPIEGGGDAKVRFEVVVQGDAVGSWGRGVKVPEEWEREHTRLKITTAARIAYVILFASLLIACAVVVFVRLVGKGEIPWRFGLAAGVVCALAGLVGLSMILESRWADTYDTSMPELLFVITLAVAAVLAPVVYGLGGLLAAGLAGGLHPSALTMFSGRSRRAYARDALLAGLVTTALLVALPSVRALVGSLVPSGRLIASVGVPGALDANPPYLGVLVPLFFKAIFIAAAGAIVVGLLGQFFRNPAVRGALALLTILAMIPLGARTGAEILVGGLQAAATLGAAVLLIRFFLRDNPLAWLWSAWLGFGAAAAAALIAQSAPLYRNSGVIALAIVIAPGLVLVGDAISGARRGVPPEGVPAG